MRFNPEINMEVVKKSIFVKAGIKLTVTQNFKSNEITYLMRC